LAQWNKRHKEALVKKKTVLIGSAIAAVLVLGGTGVAVAVTEPFDNDDQLTGSTLERASKAALDEVGEGKVTDSELEDGIYEIEVTLDNGRDVDVTLDDAFSVLSVDRDDADDDTRGSGSDDGTDDQGSGDQGTDDAPLTDDERSKAEAAALAAVAGTVTDIDRSDDADHAFEVDVTRADGTQAEVELDASFGVVRIDEDGMDDDTTQK
jgi:uncharacterized membrane protein YkoI